MRELRESLVRLRPVQLQDRSLRPWLTGPAERGERAIRGDPQTLELGPLAPDRLSLRKGCSPVARQREHASHGGIEPCDEREPQRRALVQQRRHRDLPAASDLAEHLRHGHLDAREEHLVELGVARQLPERANLDPGAAHVDDEVGEAVMPARFGVAAREKQAVVGNVRDRRPDLLTVDDEAIAFESRSRPDGGEIRAGVRLREALAPELVGREDRVGGGPPSVARCRGRGSSALPCRGRDRRCDPAPERAPPPRSRPPGSWSPARALRTHAAR